MEFESTALANQEEPAAKQRIFQGVLKGEALKWYQDVLDLIRNNWEQLTLLFLRTFREVGGEARALGRLSKMTIGTSKSGKRYGQRIKTLIQKQTTDIAPSVQVEWYVVGFPEEMGSRSGRPGRQLCSKQRKPSITTRTLPSPCQNLSKEVRRGRNPRVGWMHTTPMQKVCQKM